MAADPNKLGIFVTSPQHMQHILGLTKAAVRAGKKVKIFFTFKAIHLTKNCVQLMILLSAQTVTSAKDLTMSRMFPAV